MPWEEQPIVNQREEFVLRALEPGANIAALCREAGISRKTGYKWINRFKEKGRVGLQDLSRRPRNSPLRASGEAALQVIELRQAHPTWGPKKLHAILLRASDLDEVPSVRTIARIIDRAGLVKKRKRCPMAWAVERGQLGICKWLYDNGAADDISRDGVEWSRATIVP